MTNLSFWVITSIYATHVTSIVSFPTSVKSYDCLYPYGLARIATFSASFHGIEGYKEN